MNGFIPGAGPQSLGGTPPQRGQRPSSIGRRGVQIRRQSSFPNPSALQARHAQLATHSQNLATTLSQSSPMTNFASPPGFNPAMQQGGMINPTGGSMNPIAMAAMQYAAMQQSSMMGMGGMATEVMDQQASMMPQGNPHIAALKGQLRNQVKDTLKSGAQSFIQNLGEKGSITGAFDATIDDTKKKIKNDVSSAMAGAAGIEDEEDKVDLQEKLGGMFNKLFKNKDKAETAATVIKTGASAKAAATAAGAAGAGPLGAAAAAAVVVGATALGGKKTS